MLQAASPVGRGSPVRLRLSVFQGRLTGLLSRSPPTDTRPQARAYWADAYLVESRCDARGFLRRGRTNLLDGRCEWSDAYGRAGRTAGPPDSGWAGRTRDPGADSIFSGCCVRFSGRSIWRPGPAPPRRGLTPQQDLQKNASCTCINREALSGFEAENRVRREIWISSGLRGGASGLRESPGFGRLDLFGIPWILSSEMSLLKGLHATPGPFLIHAALSPQSGAQDPAVIRSKGRPRSNPAKQKPLGAPRSWQSTSEGPD